MGEDQPIKNGKNDLKWKSKAAFYPRCSLISKQTNPALLYRVEKVYTEINNMIQYLNNDYIKKGLRKL